MRKESGSAREERRGGLARVRQEALLNPTLIHHESGICAL